jgi:PII-like signaling protein
MLTSGPAVKVSIYVSDGARHHGIPVYTSLLDFLFKSGIYGATALKGVAGFGSTHRIHSAHILEMSELERRTGCGLIEIHETTVLIPAKK